MLMHKWDNNTGIYNNLPITKLHFEPTSACNARCPQCPRTFGTSFNTHPLLNIQEWNSTELETVLSHDFFKNITNVLINGNFGDIVMHSDPKSLIEVFLKKQLTVSINTNGGALSAEFWKWLGSQPSVRVNFGIDGMEDTHAIYRRNTNFKKIIQNATEYINAGGNARWVMTLFKHNAHQVDECRNLATWLGFNEFVARESFRFDSKLLSVSNKDFEHEYFIEPYTIDDSITEEIRILDSQWYSDRQDVGFIKTLRHDRDHFSDQVTCIAKHERSVFLSYDKRLWPCCHTAIGFEQAFKHNSMYDSLIDIFKKNIKKDYYFNNVLKNSIDDIVHVMGIFKNIENTWNTGAVCTSCVMNCKSNSHMFKQNQKISVVKISEK
jgi:MoaA/NifB/PqqE/SkfB family radical SAM enzyme